MKLTNDYAQLDPQLCRTTQPFMVSDPKLLLWNEQLAWHLHLQSLETTKRAEYFSGQINLPGSQPVACAYAGHQFGHFNPQLGDGRVHLLGEVHTDDGTFELQLKGSGQTPFSRNGDGLCSLAPALREYLMSEAMYHLGVPTSRCLAVVSTGDKVLREKLLLGAIVTRVASSHIRVGTFEYFAARGQNGVVKKLADFVIARHYPELKNSRNQYLDLLQAVIQKQITLINHWLRVGFIHGVMNTDNTLLSGETIDYGPCAMLGVYHPATVFSSIDRQGRYAFGQQARIMQWNMARLAECLLPLINADEKVALQQAEDMIKAIPEQQSTDFVAMMNRKLGFYRPVFERPWIDNFLKRLQTKQLDYSSVFIALTENAKKSTDDDALKDQLGDYYGQWRQQLATADLQSVQSTMKKHNPLVIPRNHEVEQVLSAAVENNDLQPFKMFLQVLQSPYQTTENTQRFQQPAPEYDAGYQTFCGT